LRRHGAAQSAPDGEVVFDTELMRFESVGLFRSGVSVGGTFHTLSLNGVRVLDLSFSQYDDSAVAFGRYRRSRLGELYE
jgi:hypothetical protein